VPLARLSDRFAERARPGAKPRIEWDAETPGFGLRVLPSGVKAWLVDWRDGNGKRHRIAIGRFPTVAMARARERANELLAARSARHGDTDRVTITELAERYLEEYSRLHKKPRSYEEDQRNLRLHVLPRIGKVKVVDLGPEHVSAVMAALAHMPTGANRVRALISHMMTKAEHWRIRPPRSNPIALVDRYRETPRARMLSDAEWARLAAVLSDPVIVAAATRSAVQALMTILLTGCRHREIIGLHRRDVDLEAAVLHLRDSKTGPRQVLLSRSAVALLAASCQGLTPTDPVFPGRRPGAPIVNIHDTWHRIRTAAELPDLRIHDLRHAFATVGVSSGVPLRALQGLLGHSRITTTELYAHLADRPGRDAVETTGAAIGKLLGVDPEAGKG
jgi:integrase